VVSGVVIGHLTYIHKTTSLVQTCIRFIRIKQNEIRPGRQRQMLNKNGIKPIRHQ
jgi:hypothetical protein